jgi:hypothetical protein
MLTQHPDCEVALGLLIDFNYSEGMEIAGATESVGVDMDSVGDRMDSGIAQVSGKLCNDMNSEADEDDNATHEDIDTLKKVWTVCCVCLILQRKVVLNFCLPREHLHLWPLKPLLTSASL